MRRLGLAITGLLTLLIVAAACGSDEPVVIEKVVEVPGETVVVEVPGETVIVEVPGETIVVE